MDSLKQFDEVLDYVEQHLVIVFKKMIWQNLLVVVGQRFNEYFLISLDFRYLNIFEIEKGTH